MPPQLAENTIEAIRVLYADPEGLRTELEQLNAECRVLREQRAKLSKQVETLRREGGVVGLQTLEAEVVRISELDVVLLLHDEGFTRELILDQNLFSRNPTVGEMLNVEMILTRTVSEHSGHSKSPDIQSRVTDIANKLGELAIEGTIEL